jgi:hypothetical protein
MPRAVGDARGKCSLTCEAFKTRAPTADEARYYDYCKKAELNSVGTALGMSPEEMDRSMRAVERMIGETADRQRGLSERDIHAAQN